MGKRLRGNGTGTAYKRGRTWTACVIVGWKDDGKAVKKTKGGFRTKRDALAHCEVLKHGVKKTPTIKALYETYESTGYTKLSASKQTAYRIAFNRLSSIHYTQIQDLMIDDLQKLLSGLTFDVAKDLKALLSHLYQIACAEQHITVNLSRFMVLPQLHQVEPVPFNDDELKKLWNAYSEGDTWIGYVLLMIYTGMMPGELLICKKSMIDFSNRVIVGAGLKTKERKSTPLVIADFMVPVIESLMEYSNTDKLISINRDNFYSIYHEKIKKYGCRDLPPYACRHTTATALAIGKNISPLLIQRIMRHATITTTQKYIHPTAEDTLDAINKLKPVN